MEGATIGEADVLLLSSQALSAYLDDLFASPTPLTSTLCGLLTLIAAGAIYAAFYLLRDRKLKKKSGESGWDKFIVWSRKVDHTIVDYWSYVTGTHYRSPALRRTLLIGFFTASAPPGNSRLPRPSCWRLVTT